MNIDLIAKTLEQEEGRVSHAYQDHKGYWTIGVGHLVDAGKGGVIPDHIINALLEWDIHAAARDLDRNKPFWRGLPENVANALVLMCFQLGWPSMSGFKKMWAALEDGDYKTAAREALDSKWGKTDTPARAGRVARMMMGV